LSFISFFVYPGEENTTDSQHSALHNLDFLNFTVKKMSKKLVRKKHFALIQTWGVGVWGLGLKDKENL
jgi:hypothetical protein